MKHHIYLCGPMTGLPDFNHPAFNTAAQALRESGYDVFSPTENGVPRTADWATHMRADIAALTQCRSVATLPGWAASKGAMLEVHIARQLGMPVASVNAWLLLKDESEVAA